MIDRKSRLNQLDLFPPLPRPLAPQYQLTRGNNTYHWYGRGRLPTVFSQFLADNQHLGTPKQLLKSLHLAQEIAP